MGLRKLNFNFYQSNLTNPEKEVNHEEDDTEEQVIHHEVLEPDNTGTKVISKRSHRQTDSRI